MPPPHPFSSFFTIFLSLPLLLLPRALSLPPPPPSAISLLNLTHPHLLDQTFCIPKRGIFTPIPDYYDCAHAIFQLPSFADDGSFHNGLPSDPFRLPVARTNESCRVRVELRHEGGSTEGSSWRAIIGRALTLAGVYVVHFVLLPFPLSGGDVVSFAFFSLGFAKVGKGAG